MGEDRENLPAPELGGGENSTEPGAPAAEDGGEPEAQKPTAPKPESTPETTGEPPASVPPINYFTSKRGWIGRLETAIWDDRRESVPWPASIFWRWVQILHEAFRGVLEHKLTLRASALTYTSIMSFVPLLAVAFAVMQGMGFTDSLVDEILKRFGAGTDETLTVAMDQISKFVDQSSPARLGGAGAFVLVLISISLLYTIEQALNAIWSLKRGRSFLRRVANYLGVIVIAPFLLVAATHMTVLLESDVGPTHVASIEPEAAEPGESEAPIAEPPTPHEEDASDAQAYGAVGGIETQPPSAVETSADSGPGFKDKLLRLFLPPWLRGLMNNLVLGPFLKLFPYLFIWAVFIAVYFFVPNTRVRPASAVVGGLVGGTLWQLAQINYIAFTLDMVQRYHGMYGGFAWALILLVWVYLSWVILLFGAEITHAHHNLEHRRRRMRLWRDSPSERETLALRLAVLLARPLLDPLEKPLRPLTTDQLADALRLSPVPIQAMLDLFRRAGLVTRDDEIGGYIMSRSPQRVGALDLLRLVRHGTFSPLIQSTAPNAGNPDKNAAWALCARLENPPITELSELPWENIQTFLLDEKTDA